MSSATGLVTWLVLISLACAKRCHKQEKITMRENAKNKRFGFAMVNTVLRCPVECHRPKERQVSHVRPTAPLPANLARPARGPPPSNDDSWQARPRTRAGDRKAEGSLGRGPRPRNQLGAPGREERGADETRAPAPARARRTGNGLPPRGGGELRSTRNGARDEEED